MLEDRTTAASTATRWPAAYPKGYAVVDVETTGLARHDRIISAAVYRLDARGGVEDHWYTLVNPERDPGPVWIHGLTNDVLEGAPLSTDIAEEFSSRLDGRVLVAHNAVFDWQMIAREYARAEREAPVRQRLWTIALSKELGLPLPNHKLETLAAHFGVVQQRAHHALDDARVLAEAFRPSLGPRPRVAYACPARVPAADRVVGRTGAPDRAAGGRGGLGDRPTSWRPARRGPPALSQPGPLRRRQTAQAGRADRLLRRHAIERDLLEDRATRCCMRHQHLRLTSLFVTNDPDSAPRRWSRPGSSAPRSSTRPRSGSCSGMSSRPRRRDRTDG
ncbi:DEDDh family exonuclease OS=Streptomyces alboniger OX=132473 GN=CP975_07690 PE=4 SV=1 [Streptomyces alboniger]